MTDFNTKIRARIETFVADLEDLIRQGQTEAINDALRGALQSASRRSVDSSSDRGADASPARGRRVKGEKRSRDAIRALGERVLAHLTTSGGARIEELGKSLSISTRDLTLPLKQLIKSSKVRKEGQRRATRYFAGKGRPRRKG